MFCTDISILLSTENLNTENFNITKPQKFQYYWIQFWYFQTPSAYLVTILNALVPSNN